MFERCVLMSGQFLIPDAALELQIDRFKILVEMTLGAYNGYCPIDQHVYKSITQGRQYTFTAENSPEGIPLDIVSAVPVRISGVSPFFFSGEFGRPSQSVQAKVEYPFVYRAPTLTVPASAEYDLHCIFNHKVVEVAGVEPQDYEVTTLSDQDDEFLDLLQARFLIALGRSRRAFTVSEMPISVDASELVAEGKDLEAEAMTEIKDEKAKWYLAWR